ncbi:MAG TPA: SEC-C metal-binding domain-containing protein [Gemmataceae bacterium]|nr:SEC-C metal-binding domain-containing protein [Gemmataceae bacterium]
MRLPEAKIREAILHPEKLVRQEALQYFADCFSRDADVMPLAIRAIETYGRSDAFRHVHFLAQLRQTEATVEWAVRELYREADKVELHDSYFPALSQLLCGADPQLLIPRSDEVLQAPGFFEELAPAFRERLRLDSWDADQCWKELERVCSAAVGKHYSSDVNFGHASLVVETLARQGEKYVDRILDLLDQKVEDFETDPMTWLEIFLVELAGEMRLEPAIPRIVKKLHECGELLSEECVEALGKIGTDAAAEAVTDGWLEAVWEYRLYATSALDVIHSDTTVRKCLELLPQDKDLDIRTKLADALLGQFAEEGIEPVREMVERRAYDPMNCDLTRKLVVVSTVLGATFPEYPIWKREAEERLAKQERRMREMGGFFEPPAKLTRPPKPALSNERGDFLERKPAPFLRVDKQVGRNDPCPCGSGKKFKKCCMSRGKKEPWAGE